MTTVTKDSVLAWDYAQAEQWKVDYFSIRVDGIETAQVQFNKRSIAVGDFWSNTTSSSNCMVIVVAVNAQGESRASNQMFLTYVSDVPAYVENLRIV